MNIKLDKSKDSLHKEEVVLSDDSRIISKTNLKGVITYVNDDFIQISGFSEKELLGKSHNIIRHSDIPKSIFENMWNHLHKRIPWRGVLKNKTKSGGFYWVDALISPTFDEKGNVLGYISVRKKPTERQINKAQRLYNRLSNGKKFTDFKLKYLHWIYRYSIQTRLIFLNIFFLTILTIISASSLVRFTQEYDFYQKKSFGSDYLIYFSDLTEKISTHRASSAILLSGDSNFKEKLIQSEKQIEETLNKISILQNETRNYFFDETAHQDISVDWFSLKNDKQKSLEANLTKHTNLITKYLYLSKYFADSTNLNKDSSSDTLYIELLTTRILPHLLESLGQLKLESAMAFSKSTLPISEKLKIKGIASSIDIYSEQISTGMEFAKKYSPDLDNKTIAQFDSLLLNTKKLSKSIDKNLSNSESSNFIPAFREMSNLTSNYIEFNNSLHLYLNKKLYEKMLTLKIKVYTIIFSYLLFILLIYLINFTIIKSIQDSIDNSMADSIDHFKKVLF
ncbi:MAG: PAS domain-containing protein [Leptospiraceae bacterium]|nr:PAS domain S-box protein [Leptospiraceae bacterium]MCK6380567.1 PAS domain-containing protein [Leptospiraceae bacterium]NUM40738.1 PAS domain S-box protein [Leptospiraceae bacterium]